MADQVGFARIQLSLLRAWVQKLCLKTYAKLLVPLTLYRVYVWVYFTFIMLHAADTLPVSICMVRLWHVLFLRGAILQQLCGRSKPVSMCMFMVPVQCRAYSQIAGWCLAWIIDFAVFRRESFWFTDCYNQKFGHKLQDVQLQSGLPSVLPIMSSHFNFLVQSMIPVKLGATSKVASSDPVVLGFSNRCFEFIS